MKPMKTKDVEILLKKNNYLLIRSNGHKVFSNGKSSVAIAHDRVQSVGVMRTIYKTLKGDTI